MYKERFLISPPHLGNQVTKSTIGVPPRKSVELFLRKEVQYGLV